MRRKAKQEEEFNKRTENLRNELLQREALLKREFEQREAFFVERERAFNERQRDYEAQINHRQVEVDALKARLNTEIAKREDDLKKLQAEFASEKEKYTEESRKRVRDNSSIYITDALKSLKENEDAFHSKARQWARIGSSSLILSAIFFIYVTINTIELASSQVSWQYVIFNVCKGAIAIAILAALSRYSHQFSTSYMREALKNADRRHAINFGKFYLESYGAAAEWNQIKDAFAHWNTSGTSSFNESQASSPMADAEKAVSFIEKISKAVKSGA